MTFDLSWGATGRRTWAPLTWMRSQLVACCFDEPMYSRLVGWETHEQLYKCSQERSTTYARTHVLPYRFTKKKKIICTLISVISGFKCIWLTPLGVYSAPPCPPAACCAACGSFTISIQPPVHYKIIMCFHMNIYPSLTPLVVIMICCLIIESTFSFPHALVHIATFLHALFQIFFFKLFFHAFQLKTQYIIVVVTGGVDWTSVDIMYTHFKTSNNPHKIYLVHTYRWDMNAVYFN